MQIPTLTAERLALCPPGPMCEGAYERFFMDAQSSNGYGGAPLTASGVKARLASELDFWHLNGFGMWAIRFRDGGGIVGGCGFSQQKGWPKELTWWLLPEFRDRGIAYEASLAAIRHAYYGFRWERVETYMKDTNEAARALALRLGGIKIDRRPFPDGLIRDVFLLPPPPAA